MSGSHMENSPESSSPIIRLLNGSSFGLAQTYWTFYLLGAALFFVVGSVLVADHNWAVYAPLLAATLVYSFILLFGVQRYYRGSDPGKALGRIGMLFLLLNLSNVLATLSFF